jgi:hypothetical protein
MTLIGTFVPIMNNADLRLRLREGGVLRAGDLPNQGGERDFTCLFF